MNIAENSLNLLVARMAWATHVSKRPGVDIPLYDYTAGFNVQPKRFVFDLRARSESRNNIVSTVWENGKNRDPMRSAYISQA